jgi:hypothetical protein
MGLGRSGRGLTIRPSRCRFAARLNSGVSCACQKRCSAGIVARSSVSVAALVGCHRVLCSRLARLRQVGRCRSHGVHLEQVWAPRPRRCASSSVCSPPCAALASACSQPATRSQGSIGRVCPYRQSRACRSAPSALASAANYSFKPTLLRSSNRRH